MNDEGAFERRKEVIEMSVYVKFETPKEISDKAYSLAEMARDGGKLKNGTNEVTKVVERGRGDKLYVNTAGIGFVKYPGLSPKKLRDGDAVIVSGMVGDHGTAIMLARSGMMQGKIMSDCAPLNGLCEAILGTGAEVRVLRDPTRGGVATTLNEFIEGTALGIGLYEDKIPVRDQVRSACDMLGLDPLYCANEGKLLAVAAADDAERVLSAMRETEEGRDAAIIGRVSAGYPGKLVMDTAFGGKRILQKLTGAQLPRIC